MKRLGLFALLVVAAFGTGCATTHTAGHKSGPDIEMPVTGKSKVVFIRPSQYAGRGVVFGVHDEDRLIGVLQSGSFFEYECEPGHHLFSSSMEDVAMLEADLLPDRIYYAKVSSAMGWLISQVNMYSLHPGCAGNLWPELPHILAGLRESVVTSRHVERDRKHADTYRERIEKYLEYKYRPNPNREQILPEHGQTQPIAGQ